MWRKIVNQRGINSFLDIILIVGFSILVTGCLNLAGDVTPPPDINQTQPVTNTPVPSQEPTREEPQPEEIAPQDLDTGTIMVEVSDHSGELSWPRIWKYDWKALIILTRSTKKLTH